MKPKPFWSLNHLTVPVAIFVAFGEIELANMQTLKFEHLRKNLSRTEIVRLPKNYKGSAIAELYWVLDRISRAYSWDLMVTFDRTATDS